MALFDGITMLSFLRVSIVPFILRNRYRKEMILIIFLKILALFILWGCFFSHPVSRGLDHSQLIKHFISLKSASEPK
ncbi:hypothetical protein [Aquicella lusitana]|uniref:hypothetical protein n=1 Tax=Aquicella lusitana TaxID=254246 RepID=UPI000E0C85CB|nr:hypothetical protein [Aquicella lusitana]